MKWPSIYKYLLNLSENLSTPAAAFSGIRSGAAIKELWSLRLHTQAPTVGSVQFSVFPQTDLSTLQPLSPKDHLYLCVLSVCPRALIVNKVNLCKSAQLQCVNTVAPKSPVEPEVLDCSHEESGAAQETESCSHCWSRSSSHAECCRVRCHSIPILPWEE